MQRVDVWNVKTGCVVKSIRRDFLSMTRFGVCTYGLAAITSFSFSISSKLDHLWLLHVINCSLMLNY